MSNARRPTFSAGALDGKPEAFEAIVEALRPRLEALIVHRLGERLRRKVEVADLVQETLLRGFRSVKSFRGDNEESFLRWLGGIANHVILENARRHRHDLILAVDDALPDGSVSQSRASRREERFDRLQSALNSLSAEHREVIVLARVERLSINEVAERMDRSTAATSQLLWRALQKLRETFGSTDSFHLPDRQLVNPDKTNESHGP